MKTLPASPRPARNPNFNGIADIVWSADLDSREPYEAMFNRRRYSREAILHKAQYFALEEMLLQAFEFVAPASENAEAFSIKFATIIKDACNVFEIVCRSLYEKFYIVENDERINIFNFLSLDEHLQLSDIKLVLVATLDQFVECPEISAPYAKVKEMAPGFSNHDAIPVWWKAYNSVKHSNEDLGSQATLANAMASTAALFTLLNRTYGYGLVYGMASLPDDDQGFLPNAKSSLLFSPEP